MDDMDGCGDGGGGVNPPGNVLCQAVRVRVQELYVQYITKK